MKGEGAGQPPPLDFSKSSDYDKLIWAISELEERERREKTVNVRKDVNERLSGRLVRLIGEKPLLDVKLNNVDKKVLLDTGSMPSVLDEEFRRRHLPSTPILPVSDFLGEGEEVPVFKTANNTILPVSGVVVVDFTLGESTFQVPFLVTSIELSHPILGFNVMEHFVVNGRRDDVLSALQLSVGSGIDVGNLSVMVNLIQRNFEGIYKLVGLR